MVDHLVHTNFINIIVCVLSLFVGGVIEYRFQWVEPFCNYIAKLMEKKAR